MPKSVLYTPTPADKQLFHTLLEATSAPKSDYNAYLTAVNGFLEEFRDADKLFSPVRNCRLLLSTLFHRRFLVATEFQNYFGLTAQHLNGTAVTSISVDGIKSPPLVVLPIARTTEPHAKSILEHEMVHINQMITERFTKQDFANRTFESFLKITRVEFDANFLQLVRWPALFPYGEYNLSLYDWCVLRGYTQALERVMEYTFGGGMHSRILLALLSDIETRLSDGFAQIDITPDAARPLLKRLPEHVLVAAGLFAEVRGAKARDLRRMLNEWIGERRPDLIFKKSSH